MDAVTGMVKTELRGHENVKLENLELENSGTRKPGKIYNEQKKVMMSTFAITSQRRYFDEMMNEEPKDEER